MAWSRFVANGGEDAMEAMREHVVGEEQFLERKGCDVWLGREGNHKLSEAITAAELSPEPRGAHKLLLAEQNRRERLLDTSFPEVPYDMKLNERRRVESNIQRLQSIVGGP